MAAKVKLGPAGGASDVGAPALMNMMVSLPATANMQSAWPNDRYRDYYWSYVAPQTGRILVDVHLSHSLDADENPNWYVNLYVDGPGLVTYFGTDEYGEAPPNTDARFVDVTEGETYIFRVRPEAWGDFESLLNVVVRVSDFATSRTGPTPNLDYSFLPTTFTSGSSGTGDALVATTNHHDEYDSYGDYRNRSSLGYASPSIGHYALHRGYQGVAPYILGDAITCCWNHARRMSYPGYVYWGPNGAFEWNGGPGTCLVHGTMTEGEGSAGPGNVGTRVRSYGWGFGLGAFRYRELDYWLYWTRMHFSFEEVRQSFMDTLHVEWAKEEFGNGLSENSDGTMSTHRGGENGTGMTLTWDEVTAPDNGPGEIVALQVVPDEWSGGGVHSSGVEAEWFMMLSNEGGGYPYPPGADQYNWPMDLYHQAVAAGESIATYEGGYHAWIDISEEDILAAKAVERRLADLDQGYYQYSGMQFALVTKDFAEASPPVWPPYINEWESGTYSESTYALREGQSLGFRMTGRYPDWIVVDNPAYPDASSLGIGGELIDSDRDFVGRT